MLKHPELFIFGSGGV